MNNALYHNYRSIPYLYLSEEKEKESKMDCK